MSQLHRTLIVPAATARRCADLCAALAGPPGAGMFTTALSPTGAAPATHFISAGMIEDTFAAVLADPAVMHGACQAAGISITLAECTALLAAADISEEPPFDALARVGLKLIAEVGV
ncbi:hypothetical protein [Variovorax sp. UMC13]|uniref:hypothetical protein n=1 Tax=Variovorax sp. UMC13 TaxID=1862326 RepID=UPI0016030940|nr:hypothetical protein [Variovorax sp. UMC13]MBB1599986.1 hypothetical protein [Variovorax sp. UMC13]